MKIGDLVRIKNMRIPTEGHDHYLGIIIEQIDKDGFIVYFFSSAEYYGYEKNFLEVVN